ncbi:MAG: hypothetical protein GEU74_13775 [Nitriliruptorales bacterium]|nr:hypothetical protein [Nitriliruptorales bacterium]
MRMPSMPLFPSTEWMAEFCARLAAHSEAPEIAQALDGVYRFVIEPAGPLSDRHSYDISIRPTGAGANIGVVDGERHGDPRLTMTADYRRWQQLVQGELDIGMAVMLRRLRVSGDLSSLIGNVSNAGPLVESLHEVDTTWLEDS